MAVKRTPEYRTNPKTGVRERRYDGDTHWVTIPNPKEATK